MAKDLKSTVLSPENIALAYQAIQRDRYKVDWSETVPARAFTANPMLYTSELIQALHQGRYRPGNFRRLCVHKPNGKTRLLGAYYARDKMAQRLVLQVVQSTLEHEAHPCSYGYRPGRNRYQALDKARQYVRCAMPWVLDADIIQFFDTIPHPRLLRVLRQYLSCPWCRGLIQAWLEQGYYPALSLRKKRGIPQGAIISPWLCNLYLTPFDREMDRHGIPFVRYADDFLLFTRSERHAERARRIAQRVLKTLELELHPEKTHILHVQTGVRFLGLDLLR